MLFPSSVLLYVVLACVPLISAQVPFPSHCPNVTVMSEFDVDAYMGVWYEHSKYPFAFEIGKKCMYATYENIGNGTVAVVNSAINRFTGKASNVTGTATILAPGQLSVSFSRNQRGNKSKPNYIVLGTDYESFAVVYSCSNFTPIVHIKVVWILTRERIPKQTTVAAAKQILSDNKISRTFLLDTVQTGCPDPIDVVGTEPWTESELSLDNENDDMTTAVPKSLERF